MDFNVVLKPLRRIEDLQRILGYMEIFSRLLPNRYVHIAGIFNTQVTEKTCKLTEQEVAAIVQTLDTLLPRFNDNPTGITSKTVEQECNNYLQKGILDVGLVNILPPVERCCGSLIKVSSRKTCTVYRSKAGPVVGIVHHMKCNKCNTLYKCSSYKSDGKEMYYNNVLELRYFMSTCETVFEMSLLEEADTDIFRKSASFESIAFAYNDVYVGREWMEKDSDVLILDRRRLSEAWYKLAFIRTKQRYCKSVDIEYILSEHLETVLENHIDQFWQCFTKEWSTHSGSCNHKVCSKTLVIDGHMKGTRTVCAEKNNTVTLSAELGEVRLNCKKMPLKSSVYCEIHKTKSEEGACELKEATVREIDGLECNTLKDKTNVGKYKTAGICAAVYNCGVIVGITELFGSESLSQVYMFLVWLAKEMLNFPHLLAYDDACHLKKFVCNPVREDRTECTKLLATIRMVVDKMHFPNHVDKWCRRNVNPYTDDLSKDINTEACEQTFRFISKYKYATKHMTYARYNLFMMYVCGMYNRDRFVRNNKRCRYANDM